MEAEDNQENHRSGGLLKNKERSNTNWNRRNEQCRSRSNGSLYEEINKMRSEEGMKCRNTDSESEDIKEVNHIHTPKRRHHIAMKIDEKSDF